MTTKRHTALTAAVEWREAMRLIDADKLKQPIGSYNPIKYTYEYGNVITVADIDTAPTIEPVKTGACEQIKWERDVAIEQLKSIGKGLGEKMDDVEPVKTGKWLYNGSDGYNMFGEEFRWKKCSLCGYSYSTELSKSYNYCPNCGARMTEGSEE